MELLAETVVLVELDYFFRGQVKGCPPTFDFEFWGQEHLPVLVDGSLGKAHHSSKNVFPSFMGLGDSFGEQSNPLPFAWLGHLAVGEGAIVPLGGSRSASRVPFENA